MPHFWTSSDRVPAARTRRALFTGAAVPAVVLSPLAAGVTPPAGATGSTVAQVRVTTSWSASQVVVGDRVRASGDDLAELELLGANRGCLF